MATPLDLGLLANDKLGIIFTFLFVLVLVYAILSKVKIFGDRKGLDALIAFLAALIVLFSDTVRQSIMTMAPWFVLFFFFLIFMSIAYMIFGAKTEDIFSTMKKYSSIFYWILAIGVMIWLGSMTTVIAQKGGVGMTGSQTVVNATTGEVAAGNQQSAFWATITHPKVLGLALILLIGTFTIQRLASTT
jgi:hypothetical protein